jgi:hypothetical protein
VPYDSAGWTLAYQMGVKFDRILEAFDGPFQKIAEEVKPPDGTVTRIDRVRNPAGYLLSHATNDSFIAVNRLLAGNEEVFWTKTGFAANGKTYPAGTHFIPATPATLAKLQRLASETGLTFEAAASAPGVDAWRLRPVRIGLWDQYGGSPASGWTQYILEKFEFPFTLVYPNTLEDGGLARKFDVLIFLSGA